MSLEDGAKVESWEKKEAEPMKVIKTWVRTKSGRLIEKTIMLTKEEYEEFQVRNRMSIGHDCCLSINDRSVNII